MKFTSFKAVIVIAAIVCLTACGSTAAEPVVTVGIANTSDTAETTPITQTSEETPASDEYRTTVIETSVSETTIEKEEVPNQEEKPRYYLIDSFDMVQDWSEIIDLEFPKDSVDIEKLKKYPFIYITLYEKTDLSFLTQLPDLKGLGIANWEEDMDPVPWSGSYVESYDFLSDLDDLEYLRIGKEPKFNTNYLQGMDSLKYLLFYGTNVDFEGCFPDVEELTIAGGELSSDDLYEFFPNLSGLEIYANSVSLKSVGKMDKLEILRLSFGQSYSEINELVNNKKLRALSLSSRINAYTELVEDEEFILQFPDLEYLWCLEGVISDETIDKLLEQNPDCDAFNHGM